MTPIVAGTQAILGALRDKITTFKIGAEVLKGVSAIDTAGDSRACLVRVRGRRRILDDAAQGKKPLAGYHWAYPGLGAAEAKDGGFVYVPEA